MSGGVWACQASLQSLQLLLYARHNLATAPAHTGSPHPDLKLPARRCSVVQAWRVMRASAVVSPNL